MKNKRQLSRRKKKKTIFFRRETYVIEKSNLLPNAS